MSTPERLRAQPVFVFRFESAHRQALSNHSPFHTNRKSRAVLSVVNRLSHAPSVGAGQTSRGTAAYPLLGSESHFVVGTSFYFHFFNEVVETSARFSGDLTPVEPVRPHNTNFNYTPILVTHPR